MKLSDVVVLVGAGVLAGTIGTAGGITSLVSYPALLAIGIAPLPANLANIVALVACWPGSATASRPELQGRGHWLRRWALVAAVGGAIGSGLLLSTPAGLFARVVPFLVAGASVGLLAQPWLYARHAQRIAHTNQLLLPAGLLLVAIYNGYFGAGSGIMLLALLLLLAEQHLARANALKNMLVGAASVVSAVTFIVFTSVDWAAVLPLAARMFVGSTLGPRIARRLPSGFLRWLVAMIGIGLAVWLWVRPT